MKKYLFGSFVLGMFGLAAQQIGCDLIVFEFTVVVDSIVVVIVSDG